MEISIIIPVYNEAENIVENLDAIQRGIAEATDKFNVYIVYDMEEDNTLPAVENNKSRYGFPVYFLKNSGRGVCQAIKTGMENASGDFLLVTMADMSDDYSILRQMAERAKEGFDIVCGSRYMPGGRTHGGPFLKQGLSRLAGLSLHWLTGIPTHDITNSYKLYRRGLVRAITLESENGFEIGMEITAKAFIAGYKIAEVPSQWWDRKAGTSRFKLMAWIPKYLRWYFFLLYNTFIPNKKSFGPKTVQKQ